MRWQRGQDAVADLIDEGELIVIDDGPAQADQRLAQARAGLSCIREPDLPPVSGAEERDAGRVVALCAAALLAAQGLADANPDEPRVTSTVMDHQFLGDLGAGPFDSLREHGSDPGTVGSDGPEAASWAVEFTAQLLGSGRLHRFATT